MILDVDDFVGIELFIYVRGVVFKQYLLFVILFLKFLIFYEV